jgi:hypothetical protein
MIVKPTEYGVDVWTDGHPRAYVPRSVLRAVEKERDALLSNLTSTQARCTELLEETGRLKEERAFPGWFCRPCQTFNSETAKVVKFCQRCGELRPQ